MLLADSDERGISRSEPAASSAGIESRLAGQDHINLVGCVPNWRIRRGGDADKHAYFEVR